MGDVYDFMLAMDLRDELSGREVAELRWHLGHGPQPDKLTILTEFPEVVLDDDGKPESDGRGGVRTVNTPFPVLAQRGAAWRVGGALFSELVRRDGGGWALSTRQELHLDDIPYVDSLLDWLAVRAAYDGGWPDGAAKAGDRGSYLGYRRWHEDLVPGELLTFEYGKVVRRS